MKNKKPGLGHRFLKALNACYENLALNPSTQKRKGVFRHAMIHKFPYRVVYELHGELVIVYQVRHTIHMYSKKFCP